MLLSEIFVLNQISRPLITTIILLYVNLRLLDTRDRFWQKRQKIPKIPKICHQHLTTVRLYQKIYIKLKQQYSLEIHANGEEDMLSYTSIPDSSIINFDATKGN